MTNQIKEITDILLDRANQKLNDEITISANGKYLSDFMDDLPHNSYINKGITGCGGTTVEINASRNSIIVVPTKELVRNKSDGINIYGLFGDIKGNKGIKNYIDTKVILIIRICKFTIYKCIVYTCIY